MRAGLEWSCRDLQGGTLIAVGGEQKKGVGAAGAQEGVVANLGEWNGEAEKGIGVLFGRDEVGLRSAWRSGGSLCPRGRREQRRCYNEPEHPQHAEPVTIVQQARGISKPPASQCRAACGFLVLAA